MAWSNWASTKRLYRLRKITDILNVTVDEDMYFCHFNRKVVFETLWTLLRSISQSAVVQYSPSKKKSGDSTASECTLEKQTTM